MRVNHVRMPGNAHEIQLPSGETLASGGKEIGQLFEKFEPIGPEECDGLMDDWFITPYDIDPWKTFGVLRTVLMREVERAGLA